VRKVIYLDADTLILDDISRLWRTGLRGKAVAAAQDSGFLQLENAFIPWAELGIQPSGKYFNSGVLLLDLDRWRRRRLAEDVLGYLRERGGDVAFPDQDAMNVIFVRQWRELHPRWNLQLDSPHLLRVLPRGERLLHAEAIARPGILHFAGGPKPWQKKCGHRRLFLYYLYLDRTRWRGWRPD
jgi:lipopolysaccharide biosynthesis glycosyltransferase